MKFLCKIVLADVLKIKEVVKLLIGGGDAAWTEEIL
jgi:hypothetical protein